MRDTNKTYILYTEQILKGIVSCKRLIVTFRSKLGQVTKSELVTSAKEFQFIYTCKPETVKMKHFAHFFLELLVVHDAEGET